GDLLEERLRVLVPGPQPFEVEDGEAADAPDLDGCGRGDGTVHRRGQERQLEPEGVELPGDVDVFRVSRPPAGDDGDVVEPVGPSPRLTDADLHFHWPHSPSSRETGNPNARAATIAPGCGRTGLRRTGPEHLRCS